MPELPEVESVKKDLERAIFDRNTIKSSKSCLLNRITDVNLYSPKIRNRVPIKSLKTLIGDSLLSIERRGKFIFFHTKSGSLINHLGMTGCWRAEFGLTGALKKHDHFEMILDRELRLIYNDTRRFGVLDFTDEENPLQSVWTRNLGLEPLNKNIDINGLYQKLLKKKSDIKTVLLDQSFLVGIGNIYASEILFLSKIHPIRKASSISIREFKRIIASAQKILSDAIVAGGSTIRDYKQLNGQSGRYANSFKVYGKEGKACLVCKQKILKATQQGRSTYFCEVCQVVLIHK